MATAARRISKHTIVLARRLLKQTGDFAMVDDFLAATRGLVAAKKWVVLDKFFELTQENLDRDVSNATAAGTAIDAIDAEVQDASRTLSEASARL